MGPDPLTTPSLLGGRQPGPWCAARRSIYLPVRLTTRAFGQSLMVLANGPRLIVGEYTAGRVFGILWMAGSRRMEAGMRAVSSL
jgi:hypothetical protein